MRVSRERLTEKYPSWNEDKNDIVKTLYGDTPLRHYTKKDFDFYDTCKDKTLKNILLLDSIIWKYKGDFDEYRLINGNIKVSSKNEYIIADLNFRGYYIFYNNIYNNIYNKSRMSITKNYGIKVKGWSNFRSYCASRIEKNNEELDRESIIRILNYREWNDFGKIVKDFGDNLMNLYERDETNHYLDEWRNLDK